jgi:hypothetical protein
MIAKPIPLRGEEFFHMNLFHILRLLFEIPCSDH